MAYDREVREYKALVRSQHEAPDWPYRGMSYASSESAADERFEFWQAILEWRAANERLNFWKELAECRGERYAASVYRKAHR